MDLSSYRLSDEAMLEANRGNLIQAIKLAHTETGLGLKEAKELVDNYVAGAPVFVPSAAAANSSLSSAVISAAENGKLIEAIKILRAETGLGLKESKDAVEAYLSQSTKQRPRSQTFAKNEGSQWGNIILIALLFAGLVAAVLALSGKL